MRESELRNDAPIQIKVWRPESMEFILASCLRRRIQTVPDHAVSTEEGSFLVTLLCDGALADEVRAEFNARPIHRYLPRRR